MKETAASNRIHCASYCLKEDGCIGFGFDTNKTCTLLSVHMKENYCVSNTCVPRKDVKVYMSEAAATTTTTTETPTTTTTTETPTTTTTTETPTTTTTTKAPTTTTTTKAPTTTTTTETPTTTTTTETPTTTTTTKTPTTTTTTKTPTTTTTTKTPTTSTTTKTPTTTSTTNTPTTTTTAKATTTTKKAPTTPPPETTPTQPEISTMPPPTTPTITTPVPTMPTVKVSGKCAAGVKLMRGLHAKESFFDGKDMTLTNCFILNVPDPYVKGTARRIEGKVDKLAKCEANYSVTGYDFLVGEDKTLQKFTLVCEKVVDDHFHPESEKTVKNNDKTLECQGNSVITGLKVTRSSMLPKYTVTAYCKELKAQSDVGTPKAANPAAPKAANPAGFG
ncbi:hypothetical protein JTE90_004313 [Oedothorax gibbosus]|uniref:Uncharacterized protein n=1 Tax=Oedothorax gibbosus TaxID=931172 RepID=A0AAV6VKA0_9ARAC|nr:hypothetical protein JTE90_004313 [Oedothorax gibbosus]